MSDQTDAFRALTRALYAVISSPPGQRDWESIRTLYHPDARLVRTGLDGDGKAFARVMSFDDYVANVTELLAGVRFTENELHQQVQVFGNVAQLASVYSFTRKTETQLQTGRGVNFLTLVCIDDRWRIMSIVWDNERDGLSLDAAALLPAAD